MGAFRFLRAAASVALLLAMAGCTSNSDALPPVTLIGERAGILVWRPVDGATVYEVQVIDSAGAVVFGYQAADTVSPLPPLFEPPKGAQWWVRALSGNREVAASPRERLY